MEPIRSLAEGREREAGSQVAAARRAVAEAEQQLAQLRTYRADYEARFRAGAAADGVRLQNYHAFLGRFTVAIEQQQQALATANAQLERLLDAWRERRIEAASIGKAVDRIATQEQRAADRRRQHEDDEHAIQRTLRTRDPG